MAGGEVCKETFIKVSDNSFKLQPDLDIPSFRDNECCVLLPALADSGSDDEFKNDFYVALFYYDRLLTSSVTLKLQEKVGGVWGDVATLIDDTYGTNYSYDFQRSKDDKTSFVGYRLDWKTILAAVGEGIYRVEATHTDILGNPANIETTFEFCLKQYTIYNANETTRFTWYLDGIIGDTNDDELLVDYRNLSSSLGGGGWENQLRLPKSFFGRNKSDYEREYVRYSNGQQEWVRDEQIEVYEWQTGRYDGVLHSYIKTNLLQGDRILVSDYNKLNSNKIVNRPVKPRSNYEPEYVTYSLYSRALVEFEQEFQNRRKLRC